MVKNLKYRMEERLLWGDVDDNFDALMHATGFWDIAEAYTRNEVVWHDGGLWICQIDNTGIEPSFEALPANGGNGEWVPMVYPGSGAASANVPQVIGDLNAFTPVEFDTQTVQPYGCTYDLVNSTFTIDFAGIWQEQLNIFFEHDNSNSARNVILRLWNVTEGSIEGEVTIGIARNVTDSNTTLALMTRFLQADVGDAYRWELGPGSGSVNSVTINAFTFSTLQVSV